MSHESWAVRIRKITKDLKNQRHAVSRCCTTWHARPQRHDGDGSDLLLDVREAAKVGGDVADDGRQDPDPDDRQEEGGPATKLVWETTTWGLLVIKSHAYTKISVRENVVIKK